MRLLFQLISTLLIYFLLLPQYTWQQFPEPAASPMAYKPVKLEDARPFFSEVRSILLHPITCRLQSHALQYHHP
jgi:hypothetical protein